MCQFFDDFPRIETDEDHQQDGHDNDKSRFPKEYAEDTSPLGTATLVYGNALGTVSHRRQGNEDIVQGSRQEKGSGKQSHNEKHIPGFFILQMLVKQRSQLYTDGILSVAFFREISVSYHGIDTIG